MKKAVLYLAAVLLFYVLTFQSVWSDRQWSNNEHTVSVGVYASTTLSFITCHARLTLAFSAEDSVEHWIYIIIYTARAV